MKIENLLSPARFAKDVGVALLVGASFAPTAALASDIVEPTESGDVQKEEVSLSDAELPAAQISSSPTRMIRSSAMAARMFSVHRHQRPSLPGFLSFASDLVEFADLTKAKLNIGREFDVFGERNAFRGRVGLSSRGGVKVAIEGRNPERLPRVELLGDADRNGARLEFRISIR